MRRQMDVNYGGGYGSRTWCATSGGGGALINVGSALCDRAIRWEQLLRRQHAEGFTDAAHGLEEEGAPIVVTLVKPASIGRRSSKAKTYLGVEPQPVRRSTRGRLRRHHGGTAPDAEIIAGGAGAKRAPRGSRHA
jgi:hypothetical protein